MFSERTSVGLDVHARSVAAAAIDTATGEFFKSTLVPQPGVAIDWTRSLPGPAAVTSGLIAAGCDVVTVQRGGTRRRRRRWTPTATCGRRQRIGPELLPEIW